jgi:transcriptional regulator with XRE-family HTH domain
MAIKAHLQSAQGQRSTPRRSLMLTTSGRMPGGAEANVTVHNISAAGLLLETTLELDVGAQLAIDLPEAGAVDAVIVWRSEHLYGCAFEQTIGHAALAATQLRAEASAAPLSAASAGTGEGLGAAFGSKLNRLRRERGLTLADVADALGVSKPTVWAWEKGKARPLPERLDAIAAALGVKADDLVESNAASAKASALIEECRGRIAGTFAIAPAAVRIMIEL